MSTCTERPIDSVQPERLHVIGGTQLVMNTDSTIHVHPIFSMITLSRTITYAGLFALAFVLALGGGCAHGSTAQPSSSSSTSSHEASSVERGETATPPDVWIEKRVMQSRQRLSKSKAGRMLWQSIQAHGGLETWYANGPVYVHYNYQPLGERGPRNTYQTIDTWSARARHQMANQRDHEYGWDGSRAWYRPGDWELPYDVRFWALTPYYFVGMPFVLADPGVDLSYEGTSKMEGQNCDVVRATFGEVGISPDDFYVLYLDREDHTLQALRYIVSYPKFFPEGGHSPEKLMTYDERQTVEGITFAKSYRFYQWKSDQKTEAEKVTDATLTNVEFRPETPNAYFEIPEGATPVAE